MADAAGRIELVDVRGLGLDQLRDSPSAALRGGVHRLLLDREPTCARGDQSGGGGCVLQPD
ncbi:hypothetical protein [Frankia canadensis]|nr:hypothetical protein [Frankia canadensis]